MNNTSDSYEKINDAAKQLAEDLKNVLKKLKETKLDIYDSPNFDYVKEFVKEKSNFTDTFSVMDGCVFKLKMAVKELDDVCVKYTKPAFHGGIFSIANIYLKKISSNAKQFYRDLDRLEPAETKKICYENMKKFQKSFGFLVKSLNEAASFKGKAPRHASKLQDEDVKNIMGEIGDFIHKFSAVYVNYSMDCFTN